MVNGERRLALIGVLTMVFLLSLAIAKADTAAWFVSETEAEGHMVNASTEDLISINPKVISYDANCVTSIQIDITNISEIEVPIQLKDFQETLSPGESFSKVLEEKVACDATETTIDITGLNHYIEESIRVSLHRKSLKETSDPDDEPDPLMVEDKDDKGPANENESESETKQVDRAETEMSHQDKTEADGQDKE